MTRLVIQIPAYNEAKTLPIALAELPRQIEGVDDIKVVVIDDGSSDETKEMITNHSFYALNYLYS